MDRRSFLKLLGITGAAAALPISLPLKIPDEGLLLLAEPAALPVTWGMGTVIRGTLAGLEVGKRVLCNARTGEMTQSTAGFEMGDTVMTIGYAVSATDIVLSNPDEILLL